MPTDTFKNFPQPEWWGLRCATTRQSRGELRTALLWVITQRIVVTAYRRFGATYRSHSQGPLTTTRWVITQRKAGFIYFAAEAWNHAKDELKTGAVTTGEVECSCTELQLYDYVTKQSPSLGHSVVWGSSLTLRSLTLHIYGAPILDVSRSHTTTQHSR